MIIARANSFGLIRYFRKLFLIIILRRYLSKLNKYIPTVWFMIVSERGSWLYTLVADHRYKRLFGLYTLYILLFFVPRRLKDIFSMVLCGKRWHDFFIVCHNLGHRRWYACIYTYWKPKIGPKVSIYLQKNMPSRVRNKEINIFFSFIQSIVYILYIYMYSSLSVVHRTLAT